MKLPIEINQNECHLWFAYDQQISDVNLIEEYHQCLNLQESEKQKNFYFPRHRHQYLVTRSLVRDVLSKYVVTIAPKEWQFKNNKYNKPSIANLSLPFPLRFNLSHTEEMIVFTVTSGWQVGVDVENLSRENTIERLAKNSFSTPEYQALMALPIYARRHRFYQLWTLKEAYIKACGMGMSIPLKDFSFSLPENNDIAISFEQARNDNPKNWQFYQLTPSNNHLVSLALKGQDASKRNFKLTTREVIPFAGAHPVDFLVTADSTGCIQAY